MAALFLVQCVEFRSTWITLASVSTCILFRYVLTVKPSPDEWNDALRKNFLKGYNALLDLLKCMQVKMSSFYHLKWPWPSYTYSYIAGIIYMHCCTAYVTIQWLLVIIFETMLSYHGKKDVWQRCPAVNYFTAFMLRIVVLKIFFACPFPKMS